MEELLVNEELEPFSGIYSTVCWKEVDTMKYENISYSEARVLVIPPTIRVNENDILILNSDSFSTEILSLVFASKICLSQDTTYDNVTAVYSFKYFQESSYCYNTISLQPKVYWLAIEDWNIEEKRNLDRGLMDDVYKDDKGYLYVVFHEGYYSNIRESYCCGRMSSSKVIEIQKALNERGFEIEVNGDLNAKTKAALTKFQVKNGFCVGNLNEETMNALGLNVEE